MNAATIWPMNFPSSEKLLGLKVIEEPEPNYLIFFSRSGVCSSVAKQEKLYMTRPLADLKSLATLPQRCTGDVLRAFIPPALLAPFRCVVARLTDVLQTLLLKLSLIHI